MFKALELYVLAVPKSYSTGVSRTFVVEIYQEVSNIHNPKTRNIQLAQEAFVAYAKDVVRGDMTLWAFHNHWLLEDAFPFPEGGDMLMRLATDTLEAFRVVDIQISEVFGMSQVFKAGDLAGNLFVVAHSNIANMRDQNLMLASSRMEALDAIDQLNGNQWDFID
jgi:hypothetical protein